MKKILLSLSVVAAVSAVVLGATTAFYSDTETSTGNTFTAGAIDLTVDNESYAIDCNIPLDAVYNPNPTCTGALVASAYTTWELTDLTFEKFFNFVDLKPGDLGEDTISLHVNSNDAWVCAAARITDDNDVDYTEPEEDADLTMANPNPALNDGELDENLQFVFWADDGDNVLEDCRNNGEPSGPCVDETQKIITKGTLSDMNDAGKIALADSEGGVFDGPVPGGETVYIGKAWCFGQLGTAGVAQDGLGKKFDNPSTLVDESKDPLVRGTGISCDGSDVNNASQTDKVVGDLEFYAEQSRNNDEFTCADWTPSWGDR